jgi:hypothetical protein
LVGVEVRSCDDALMVRQGGSGNVDFLKPGGLAHAIDALESAVKFTCSAGFDQRHRT